KGDNKMIPSFGTGGASNMMGEAANTQMQSNQVSLDEMKDTAATTQEATKAKGAAQRHTIATNAATEILELGMKASQKAADAGKGVADASSR
ncbi:MAG: hypothetical protein AAF449_18020, partial [Myxococcota bacterium]